MNSIRWRHILAFVMAVQVPAVFAQMNFDAANLTDITGDWNQPGAAGFGGVFEDTVDRGAGPDQGDFAGFPLNDAGRYKAQAFSPEWLTVPEHQCLLHPLAYGDRGPGAMGIVKIYDSVTQRVLAYKVFGNYSLARTIWMDGRPHPGPNALHTFEGFSTGKWVGDKLVVETTHLKTGYTRRNGTPSSDEASMVHYYVRHDGYLTVISALNDPAYYDEPLVRSVDFRIDPKANTQITEFGGFANGGPGSTFYKCTGVDEVSVDVGFVPHFIPGQEHTLLETFSKTYDVPAEASFGGADTMYPEYLAKLPQLGGYQPGKAESLVTIPSHSVIKPKAAPRDTTVTSQHVGGQVWLVSAGGHNVAVQIGDEGIMVVDPGPAELGPAVLAEIRKLGGNKPVREIVQTSSDMSRIGATGIVGTPVLAGGQRPAIIAHESVGLRLGTSKAASELIPYDTFYRGKRSIFFNGEPVEIIHVPAAHSDGDVIVFFRKSDVVVTGAVMPGVTYPEIDLANGGSIQGTVDALNRILGITVAEWREEGGTMMIPAMGHIYDLGDAAEYRDMVTIVRDRVADAVARGLTLEQLRAENLTRDYDVLYGRLLGPGSTAAFLEATYRSIKADATRTGQGK
jgi:glyoxylase-like metal-dependent hydrolase (beta-lactamase superfamily II)